MSLYASKERERVKDFVAQFDVVKDKTQHRRFNPVLADLSEVNNVQEAKAYLGSPTEYIRIIKDFKEDVFAFLHHKDGEESYLDVIPFATFEELVLKMKQ